MKHEEIRHKLSEFIDGAITPGERSTIEQHLATCTKCSEALRELRKTIEHIHAVEEVESPAWMTQKIMANVRAEQEAKQNFWQRSFVPLFTKFPVQAVAVLFLSVTAFYIYTTLNPAGKYAEAPLGRLAKQEAPAGRTDAEERPETDAITRKEKKALQGPGYKSLDMKYSYEKPAPPAPAEPLSPAAAAKQVMPQGELNDASRAARPAAPKAASPSVMAEQTAPSGVVRSASSTDEEKSVRRQAEPSKLGVSGNKDTSQAEDQSKKEAEKINAVTEHFVHKDLPKAMKVKGLSFTTYRYRDDLPGLQWIQETGAVKRNPCQNRYLVDVALNARSLKYLYCYDSSRIKLLGVYELVNGAWSEKKGMTGR
jgi:anti-sigma factor RsiW